MSACAIGAEYDVLGDRRRPALDPLARAPTDDGVHYPEKHTEDEPRRAADLRHSESPVAIGADEAPSAVACCLEP
jgi:hypothetical protein